MIYRNGPLDYRWVVLLAGTVAQGSFSALMMGLPVLAPGIQSEFGLSLSQLGLLFMAANVGIGATLFGWGVAADRCGERAVVTLGLVGCALALAGGAAADAYATFLLCMALAGACGASVNAGTGRAVMTWFRPDERGLAMGIRQTAIPASGVAAALTLPAVESAFGAKGGVVALAVVAVVGAATGFGWLREARGRAATAAPRPSVLRDRGLWRLSAGSLLICAAQLALLPFMVVFLHDARGLSRPPPARSSRAPRRRSAPCSGSRSARAPIAPADAPRCCDGSRSRCRSRSRSPRRSSRRGWRCSCRR